MKEKKEKGSLVNTLDVIKILIIGLELQAREELARKKHLKKSK